MKKTIINLLLISILFYGFQCGDDDNCENETNTSSLTINLTPEKIEYEKGDTIWLSTEIDTEIAIIDKDNNLNIENAIIRAEIFILNLNGSVGSTIEKGYSDFEKISVNGSINQDGISSENIKKCLGKIEFNCDSISCNLKVGLKAETRGSYTIVIAIGKILQEDPGDCSPSNRLINNSFIVDSHNREVYKELGYNNVIRIPWSSGSRTWGLEDNGVYSFKVN